MADKIKIMISSRCKTPIKTDAAPVELSEIRLDLKKKIEALKLSEKEMFNVWISEDPESPDAAENSWDECMNEVKNCNILIVYYTGDGGWTKEKGNIGICHAELETAVNSEPGKVFLINIHDAISPEYKVKDDEINNRFKNYVAQINRFYTAANNKDEIIKKTIQAVEYAVIKLVQLGKRETQKGKFNFGTALSWSRLDFIQRKKIIEHTIVNQFTESDYKSLGEDKIIYSINRTQILLCCHGIPSGMSVSAARELVGQPFLHDHIYIENLEPKIKGPFHIIGCHKGVTEQQAINLLGFPDAIVVKGTFGIYVADKIQKIQMIFLENCRDDSSTRHNVQRFIEWINETGEDGFISSRAIARRKIVDVILKEKE